MIREILEEINEGVGSVTVLDRGEGVKWRYTVVITAGPSIFNISMDDKGKTSYLGTKYIHGIDAQEPQYGEILRKIPKEIKKFIKPLNTSEYIDKMNYSMKVTKFV